MRCLQSTYFRITYKVLPPSQVFIQMRIAVMTIRIEKVGISAADSFILVMIYRAGHTSAVLWLKQDSFHHHQPPFVLWTWASPILRQTLSSLYPRQPYHPSTL